MRHEQSILEVLDAATERRAARRDFLRSAGLATAGAGGLVMLSGCFDDDDDDSPTPAPSPTPTPTPSPSTGVSDADILNFALNLEYLEAQFYSFAVFGTGLPAGSLTGTGGQGGVVPGGSAPPRAVNFASEPLIGQYAREIAADEIAHVNFLRTALGSAAVAQPAINISGDETGAFTTAARAAGVVPAGGTFDPYSSPDNFLIGAFIFEDLGVTAYKGAASALASKVFLEAAAGILAAEAYHAGLVRTILYNRGQSNAALLRNTGLISDARDLLDGTTTAGGPPALFADADQPITTGTAANSFAGDANLVPADSNAIAFGRTPAQVLRVAYLNGTAGTTAGGFFPAGVNGTIRAA
jgi:hypothetical protein